MPFLRSSSRFFNLSHSGRLDLFPIRGLSQKQPAIANTRAKKSSVTMTISKKPTGRGAFIVLEGLDRSGKTTQAKLLVEEFHKVDVPTEFIRFPIRDPANPCSKLLSDYLASKEELDPEEAHLLFTLQRVQEKKRMLKLLNSGVTLVVDRYSYSGIAYSMAKGLSREWCMVMESVLPQPDLVVYIDISPEEAARRGGYGGERYENLDDQIKVHRAYAAIRQLTWKMISGMGTPGEISKTVTEFALATLDECQGRPVATQNDQAARSFATPSSVTVVQRHPLAVLPHLP